MYPAAQPAIGRGDHALPADDIGEPNALTGAGMSIAHPAPRDQACRCPVAKLTSGNGSVMRRKATVTYETGRNKTESKYLTQITQRRRIKATDYTERKVFGRCAVESQCRIARSALYLSFSV
jgi:hypothetical protein